MWGVWILMLACISLGASQERTTEYVDYVYSNADYVDVAAQQTHSRPRVDVAAQQTHSRPRPSQPVSEHKPRRPVAGKKTKPRGTTPVPIIRDIRRMDPETGAFYYHYEGGDGSMKHEVRFPNGTVLGNFTYVKENGELETQTYHHGLGTNIIENDNGNYDLHRHLEEAYVHQSGPDPVEELFQEDVHLQPNSVREQSHSRPSVAQPRPVPGNRVWVQSRPRPNAQQQAPSESYQSGPDPVEELFPEDVHLQPNSVREQSHSRPSVAQPRPVPGNREWVQSRPRPIAKQQAPSAPQPVPLDYHDLLQTAFSFQDESSQKFNPNAVDDHQAQASSLEVEVVEHNYEYPQSQNQELVPVPVPGQ